MALTTRAKVLRRLSLSDTTSTVGAFSVTINSPDVTGATINVGSASLTFTRTAPDPVLVVNMIYSSASYDTIGEIVAQINNFTGITATLLDSCPSTTPSTTLTNTGGTLTFNSATPNRIMTYSNVPADIALIDDLIPEVESSFSRACGRTFEETELTELYGSVNGPFLSLRSRPVSEIDSITYVAHDGSETVLDPGGYRFDPDTGIVERIGGSWRIGSHFGASDGPFTTQGPRSRWGGSGVASWRVVYTAGFSDIPADLSGLATQLVCDAYMNARRNRAASSTGAGAVSKSWRSIDELIKMRESDLAPWRNITL